MRLLWYHRVSGDSANFVDDHGTNYFQRLGAFFAPEST